MARPRASLPEGEGWAYEPKWDGFRAIVFVDGDASYIQSRNGKELSRYFPEVSFPAGRYVVDGELVAASFGTLGQRIHPAASRVARLAEETPARFVAFDVLAVDDDVLMERSYEERRAVLEGIAGLELTPVQRTAEGAQHWLHDEEGVIAKELAAPYLPGERKGMVKVKRVRTIDAVVMGWRPGKKEGTVGAIILGLYDAAGRAARDRPFQRLHRQAQGRARRGAAAVRDRRARQRRGVALDARPRARVGRAAPRAGRRGDVRPRLRRAHPPRHEGPALARRQAARGVLSRSARLLSAPAAIAPDTGALAHPSNREMPGEAP